MIFYIALIILITVASIWFLGSLTALVYPKINPEERAGLLVAGLLMACFIGVVPYVISITTWFDHAGDLSIVSSQEYIIKIQVERIESLTKRLASFDYPTGALLNSDTPIAAIVGAINDAESKLAEAKTERAKAIRNIEKTRIGPLSGVISFAGDYKDTEY